jgi:hypothetical protein
MTPSPSSKSSGNLETIEAPSAGLFDSILFAIQKEKNAKKSRRLFYGFVFLLLISLATIPFSSMLLVREWNESGVAYFITTAMGNLHVARENLSDVILSIIESLPVMALVTFAINLALVLFTVRLFLYKKATLLRGFI